MKFRVIQSRPYLNEGTGEINYSWPHLEGAFEKGERPSPDVIGNKVRVPLGDTSRATVEKAERLLREKVAA